MGVVRTTFGMIAACLIRRKQLLKNKLPDPFEAVVRMTERSLSGTVTVRCQPMMHLVRAQRRSLQPPELRLAQSLEQASIQQELSRSLLRLTSLLQQSIYSADGLYDLNLTQVYSDLSGADAITVNHNLLANPTLLESLRKAHNGNYDIILSLLGCLDHGLRVKRLVDKVIDSCMSQGFYLIPTADRSARRSSQTPS